MSNVQIVSKISPKKILGKVKRPESKTLLMQVIGIATGIKTGESNFGPWTALLGQFRAVKVDTGEIFQSGTCFLPRMGTELIVPMLKREGVDGLEFAFDIGVVPSDVAIGYEYYVEPKLEPGENDPLEALMNKVKQQALPAPDKADKAEKKSDKK